MHMERNPVAGIGYIEIEAVQKECKETAPKKLTFLKSEVVSRKHAYPFCFHVPEKISPGSCRWIYSMSYGGGLISGDSVTATVKVGGGCAALVSTLESTKIYHCKFSGETVQNVNYSIGDRSLLCVLPDSTICSQDANFIQSQVIRMTKSSNLVFLDWMLSGRLALNEFWEFKRYKNCIEVYVDDELVIKECTDLENKPHQTVSQEMQPFHVVGTCFIVGNGLDFMTENLSKIYSKRSNSNEPQDKDLVVSISEAKYMVNGDSITGCYLRFLASDMKNDNIMICLSIREKALDLKVDAFLHPFTCRTLRQRSKPK